MPDPRPDNVAPIPDLAEAPVRSQPPQDENDPAGERPDDPPAQDLTLPTE